MPKSGWEEKAGNIFCCGGDFGGAFRDYGTVKKAARIRWARKQGTGPAGPPQTQKVKDGGKESRNQLTLPVRVPESMYSKPVEVSVYVTSRLIEYESPWSPVLLKLPTESVLDLAPFAIEKVVL